MNISDTFKLVLRYEVVVEAWEYRRGDINKSAAKAFADELKAIPEDDSLQDRGVGVVTLLGTAQAPLIHKKVHTQISPADIDARKIAVSPPPVFQGRERDIMLISIVAGRAPPFRTKTLMPATRISTRIIRGVGSPQ